MRVSTYSTTVTSSGDFDLETKDFGVKNPALIFDILCNRMYQKPLQTMVQEYMCNARDAHREVNNPNPIEVSIPTALDPNLRIRDFGPGLSPERIDEVFVFIGESTKRANNVQTGGFGVGAKVGWAYSSTFTIISVVDGISRAYLAYMGEDGVGKLSSINKFKTDAACGVEIVIGIKSEDFEATKHAVHHTSFFWDVPPVIHNHAFHFYMDGTNDVMCSGTRRTVCIPNVLSPFVAVVDGIIYPISADSIPILDSLVMPLTAAQGAQSKLFDYYNQSIPHSICLFFDTNDVDVAVNREGLRYSEKTLNRVTMVIDELIEEVDHLLIKAQTIPTLLKKVEALRAIYSNIHTSEPISIPLFDKTSGLTLGSKKGSATFRITADAPIHALTAVAAPTLVSGVGIKHAGDSKYKTLFYEATPAIIATWCVYYTDKSTTTVPKGKLRVHFDKQYPISNARVFITSKKSTYTILKQLGLIDLTELTEDKSKSAALHYAKTDVKCIYSRRTVKRMDELQPSKHCYCLFTEAASIRAKYPSVFQQFCYYVTKKQVKDVTALGIPHYTVVSKQRVSALRCILYNALNVPVTYAPVKTIYDLNTGRHVKQDNLLFVVLQLSIMSDIQCIDFTDVQQLYVRHAQLRDARKLAYNIRQYTSREPRMRLRHAIKDVANRINQALDSINTQYSLLSCMPSTRLTKSRLTDLCIYVNAIHIAQTISKRRTSCLQK